MGDENLCLSAVHGYRITPSLAAKAEMSDYSPLPRDKMHAPVGTGRRYARVTLLAVAIGTVMLASVCGSDSGAKQINCTEQQCSNDTPRMTGYCVSDPKQQNVAQFEAGLIKACQDSAQRLGPSFFCSRGTVVCSVRCTDAGSRNQCPIIINLP